jgi:transcription termination factor NusB
MTETRSRTRSAARLAAVQALYQQEMEGTPLPRLLHEFHEHRLGARPSLTSSTTSSRAPMLGGRKSTR